MATAPGNLPHPTPTIANPSPGRRPAAAAGQPSCERRLDRALRVLPLPAFVLDEAGRLLDGNPALLALLGAADVEQVPRDWLSAPALRRILRTLDREGRVQGHHVRLQPASGSSRPAAVSAVRVRRPGELPQVQGVLVDLASERELRHQLLEARRVDHLTGCRNRLFVSELAALCDPGHGTWGIVVLNIEGFRALNRELGVRAADEILRRLAAKLQRILRPGDVAVRLVGDTFALILLDSDPETTREICERSAAEAAAMHPALGLRTTWTLRQEREAMEATLGRAEDQLDGAHRGQ